jgi:hypothetical protein
MDSNISAFANVDDMLQGHEVQKSRDTSALGKSPTTWRQESILWKESRCYEWKRRRRCKEQSHRDNCGTPQMYEFFDFLAASELGMTTYTTASKVDASQFLLRITKSVM